MDAESSDVAMAEWTVLGHDATSVLRAQFTGNRLDLQRLSTDEYAGFQAQMHRNEALALARAIQAYWDWGEHTPSYGTVWEYARACEEQSLGRPLTAQEIDCLAQWLAQEGVPGYASYSEHRHAVTELAHRRWGGDADAA